MPWGHIFVPPGHRFVPRGDWYDSQWKDVIGSYMDYLFGNEVTKERILEKAFFPEINLLPLYILNYIFDNDELSTRELKTHLAETAQYSLHVVGLVFDFSRKRVIIADANGALIPGSNMEFLSIPLKTRKAKESTTLSRFDLDSRKRSSKVSEDKSCDSYLPKRRKENTYVDSARNSVLPFSAEMDYISEAKEDGDDKLN